MSNRDTTATPYRLSSDGKCYFAYPSGDAPIPTVANYTELRTKNSAYAGSWGSVTVSDPYQKGSFKHAASQPTWGSGSDDGAMTIAASGGGWWVRQFNYGKSSPIELDWYESVVDNFDITALFKQIAQKRTPYFYVRVPSRPMKLVWNNASTHDFTITNGTLGFRLYESTAPIEIYIAAPDDVALPAWKMSVIDLVIGSPVKKATYNDYLLTFTSTWTFDNRKFTNAAGANYTPPSAIHITMSATYPLFGAIRCNAAKLQGYLAFVYTSDQLDLRLAGKQRYASSVDCYGPGTVTYEDLYISDECCRKGGWTGTTAGSLDRNIALARSGGTGTSVAGNQTRPTTMKGKIFLQYGGNFGAMFVDYFGTSIDDPLTVHMMDRGITGPNEFGKPEGVHIQQSPWYQNHIGKTDAFGYVTKDEENKRFIKIINTYGAYGEYNAPNASWVDTFFLENNMVDDVENGVATHSKHMTFILVNSWGWNWQENGPIVNGVPQELDHIHYMGDGVNPACLNKPRSRIVVGKQNTIRFAKIHNAEIYDIGGSIESINATGKISVYASANWTATNLTFSGAARNIMHFAAHTGFTSPVFAVTNFHAPVGSTITVAAGVTPTFTINGVTKTLPYTVQAGDLGTAVPDIPPNPLLGAVA